MNEKKTLNEKIPLIIESTGLQKHVSGCKVQPQNTSIRESTSEGSLQDWPVVGYCVIQDAGLVGHFLCSCVFPTGGDEG